MKLVFDYLDYRDLLRDAYEEKKAHLPLYSYRMMAESLEVDGSYLFRVLQKELQLPARCVPRALNLLGLIGRQAEYFQLLVAYARERKSAAKGEILEKAMSLRDVERRELAGGELRLFRNWWTVVVRCLLDVTGGRAVPHEIARRMRPAVSEEQIKEACDLLLELGLVKKAGSGRLVPAQTHLTASGERRDKAVADFQKQVMQLAQESIDRFPRERRDISTLSLAIDERAFADIRSMLRECRRQIQKRAEEAPHPDRVMQLAMAYFPVAMEPES